MCAPRYGQRTEEPPAWSRTQPQQPREPPTVAPRGPPTAARVPMPPSDAQRPPPQEGASNYPHAPRSPSPPSSRGPPPPPPPEAPSPVDRVPPGAQHRKAMQQARVPPSGRDSSPRGGGGGGGSPGPALFEKGSFAHRKLDGIGRATAGETPLSGRESQRGSMGRYADFAARMHAADSQRSQRSARSYRG